LISSHKKPVAKKIKTRKCRYCGQVYTPRITTSLFCSISCGARYHRDLKKKKKALLSRTPVKTEECVVCNKVFEKKSPTHIVCSPECAETRRKQRDQAKKGLKENKESNYIKCNRCGKVFKSWDKTRNRRCVRCQLEIEEMLLGVDSSLVEACR
jgi:hypothetical protein